MKIWDGGGLVVYLSNVVIDVMNDFGQNWAASFFFFSVAANYGLPSGFTAGY